MKITQTKISVKDLTENYINPKEHMTNGKICNGNAINRVLAINTKIKPTKTYYTSDNSDYLIAPYARILIKNIS